MENFKKVTDMLIQNGIIEPVTLWREEEREMMSGKNLEEYEKTALFFYADYLEQQGHILKSLVKSIAELAKDTGGSTDFYVGDTLQKADDTLKQAELFSVSGKAIRDLAKSL